MASGRMAPSNAKSGRNVDPTLRPDLRLAFRRQVRQTHGTHGMQGIIFADGGRQAHTGLISGGEHSIRRPARRFFYARRNSKSGRPASLASILVGVQVQQLVHYL